MSTVALYRFVSRFLENFASRPWTSVDSLVRNVQQSSLRVEMHADVAWISSSHRSGVVGRFSITSSTATSFSVLALDLSRMGANAACRLSFPMRLIQRPTVRCSEHAVKRTVWAASVTCAVAFDGAAGCWADAAAWKCCVVSWWCVLSGSMRVATLRGGSRWGCKFRFMVKQQQLESGKRGDCNAPNHISVF